MPAIDWITLILTLVLVIATVYYAREVKRQTKQVFYQDRRPKIINLVDTTLLPLREFLHNRPDFTDPTAVLSIPRDRTSFVDIEPLELTPSQWSSLRINYTETKDIVNLIEKNNDLFDNFNNMADEPLVRLYSEGEQSRQLNAIKGVDLAVWDKIIETITGEEIDVRPGALPDGLYRTDFSFFKFILRVVEYRVNTTDETYAYIHDKWMNLVETVESGESEIDSGEISWNIYIESVEGSESEAIEDLESEAIEDLESEAIEDLELETDTTGLLYIVEIDEILTELAQILSELSDTQEKLKDEIDENILLLVDDYYIHQGEIENSDQFQILYGS